MILEIAAFTIEDAIIAAKAGADRIEFCSHYQLGGITSSKENLEQLITLISTPVFSIIRPRAGNFFYSDEEFNKMKEDILLCKQLGYDGIVTGILNADKTIDIFRTKELVKLAHPLPVTFHRAFDETTNPLQALEDVIECGCKRILTSGLQKTAFEGRTFLKNLINITKNRIIIMPGGGVRSNHIKELHLATNATEFHSAAKSNNQSIITYEQEVKKLSQYLHSQISTD